MYMWGYNVKYLIFHFAYTTLLGFYHVLSSESAEVRLIIMLNVSTV